MTSRRTILKSIGLIGLAAAGLPRQPLRAQSGLPPHWQGQPFARITGSFQNLRAEPTTDAEIVGQLNQDAVVRVKRAIPGQTVFLYNDLWLETRFGYLYSSFVQPLWYHLPNLPADSTAIGEGRWAQLTVPYSDAYWDTAEAGLEDPTYAGRMYYDSVHRVTGVKKGQDGNTWYEVEELYGRYWMRATHLRLIAPEELTPLSPAVDPGDKRIIVDLPTQTLTCLEGDTPVLQHYVATGRPGKDTPEGIHYVVDKRPSDRMTNGTAASEEDEELYDLAAVPYVCYFTWEWVAFHGCYWHNDYGQRRSAGCVNLPPEVARFIWRWTTPYPPLDEFYYRTGNALDGTMVIVRA
ncbi:MAG: L,D-transpeptidase family protein [Chloroflexi bacterium]|nr:L,D-transpeptidase family protein [Chloroflexota bacterium]